LSVLLYYLYFCTTWIFPISHKYCRVGFSKGSRIRVSVRIRVRFTLYVANVQETHKSVLINNTDICIEFPSSMLLCILLVRRVQFLSCDTLMH